jgi:HK97 gp10 family phage protein
MAGEIRVIGAAELIARLRRLASDVVDATPTAVRAAVTPIETAWRDGVPVKTGRYRDAIQVRKAERTEDGAEVTLGTDGVPYARTVEYGTPDREANGAARRAMDENSDDAVDAAADILRRRVQR